MMNPKHLKYSKIVEDFLNQRRTKEADFTHVAMGETFRGKFKISSDENKAFLKLYSKAVYEGCVFNIAEKPAEYGPLLIDLDFEISIDDYDKENKRLYDSKIIKEVIDAYNTVIEKYIYDVDDELKAYFLFEKPKPTIKNKVRVKDGVHIIYYNLTLSSKLRHIIRFKVVEILNNSPSFKKYINSVDNIIDKAVVSTNPWLLYGSKKKDGQLYKITNNDFKLDIAEIIISCSLQLGLKEEHQTALIDDLTQEKIEEIYYEIFPKKAQKPDTTYDKGDICDEDYRLIQLLNPEIFTNYEEWIKEAWIFKSVGFSFEIFDELSYKHSNNNYDYQKNKTYWDNITPSNNININLIRYQVKTYDPENYNKLTYKHIRQLDKEPDDLIKFSSRYLLPSKDTKIINNNDDVLQSNIIKFFKDESIKSFSLKAPYGTGKTQLIKTILNTFSNQTKRILWLSYRKTLTNNILYAEGFKNDYNFQSYQDNNFYCKRLIMQVESLHKLRETMTFIDNGILQYPGYDLVIIDEVESVLQQFNSSTFNDRSKENFNLMYNIINNSNKLIVLDGDISNKTYDFLNYHGKSLRLVNEINFDKKEFNLIKNKSKFYSEINEDLNQNKKIVIVSMPSGECNTIKRYINDNFQNKIVLCYIGNSSDEDKKDFNNVSEIWNKCDVLIYSPTCEAGVNFDVEHFDKMYGIVSKQSTSQRGFMQMLNRIRHLKEHKITVLYEKIKYYPVKNKYFYNYDDVKQSLMHLEHYNLQCEDVVVNGKICKTSNLSCYDVNYIYNKVEEMNKTAVYLIAYLKMRLESKGHSVNIYEETNDKTIDDSIYKMNKIEVLLNTDDITWEEYEILLNKQTRDNATEDDKNKITRYLYKYNLGIDNLSSSDHDFVKAFSSNSINKFISLIDTKNILEFPDMNTDNHTLETVNKSNLINNLLNDIGYMNIFDESYILQSEFKNKMEHIIKTNVLFTDIKNTKIRFNISYFSKKIETIKQFLGYVNSLINSYHIKIVYDRKRINGLRENVYSLEIMDDINELLQHKIDRGFKLHDTNNIRKLPTTETYTDMFNE